MKRQILSRREIAEAFSRGRAADVPPIISPAQLAQLLGKSTKTIYGWIAAGLLDGAYRKRGKHILLWRDKALDLLFNGPDRGTRRARGQLMPEKQPSPVPMPGCCSG